MSIFACFLLFCIEIKVDTSARFVLCEYICFALFDVNNAQKEFRHANMSSHLALFL